MIKDQAAGMQTVTARSRKDGPLYVRWQPEFSSYTIELKLELIEQIAEEMRQASDSGKEIGGVLLGSFAAGPDPTLRVEEVRMIPRDPEDGVVFLPSPKQYRSFVEENRRGFQGRAVIGIFRTHLRPGRLRPSLADQTMVAGICLSDVGVLLLIQGDASPTAALFLRTAQLFPEQPAIAPFHWDADELGGLPELGATEEKNSRPSRAPLVATVVLCAAIAAAAYAWSGVNMSTAFASPDDNPHLAVNGDRVLRIGWNRQSSLVQQATSAKLLIVDGENAREITLGANELRSGGVEYERTNRTVQIMLVLSMPGDFSVTQSVAWRS